MIRMEYDKAATGARIQQYRKTMGITQEALAESIEKSVRLVVDVERGVAGMSMETLLRICGALHVTPNDLLLPGGEGSSEEVRWLAQALENSSEHVRATAIEIVKAYLRSEM